MGMGFIEGVIESKDSDASLLLDLLSILNECSRRAFARSIQEKVPPADMDVAWAIKSGVFRGFDKAAGKAANQDYGLTHHQRAMIVRHASGLRKAEAAKSAYLETRHAELAAAVEAKIARSKARLIELGKPAGPMVKPQALSRRAKQAKDEALAIVRHESRSSRLRASSKRNGELALSGLGSRCFGGRQRARQRHLIGDEGSAFKSVEAWRREWDSARNRAWLFEGAKNAQGANPGVKWDPERNEASIRLTNDQAARRLMAVAAKLGVPYAELADRLSIKNGIYRNACNYLVLPLSFVSKKGRKHQEAKRLELIEALRPLGFAELDAVAKADAQEKAERARKKAERLSAWTLKHPGQTPPESLSKPSPPPKTLVAADEKYKGRTHPAKAPVSFRIVLEGDAKRPCQIVAKVRAQWSAEPNELAVFREGGCVGFDINAEGVSFAVCQADGNKPSLAAIAKNGSFFGARRIDWLDKTSGQSAHAANLAAIEIVDLGLKWNCPIALENLEFEAKKASLRYGSAGRARGLSGFAYRKLIESVIARAEKMGVEIIFCDPSWTSVVGFAKYSKLGLNADQAAAFAIARRAILSVSKRNANAQVKRRKVGGEWIGVAVRKEALAGKMDAAGRLLARIMAEEKAAKAKAASAKKAAKKAASPVKIHVKSVTVLAPANVAGNHAGATMGPLKAEGERSIAKADKGPERRLGMALGKDRRLWAARLKYGPVRQGPASSSKTRASRPLAPAKAGQEGATAGLLAGPVTSVGMSQDVSTDL